MPSLVYEVTFKGVASDTLRAAFDDCALETGHGVTTLHCTQTLLRDVLTRIQDLGLDLVDVTSRDQPPPIS
jgi:hypothetical protein